MHKTVLRDYRYHFKEAFKNLGFQEYFLYLYSMVMAPIFFNDSSNNILHLYAAFFPFMTGLILSRMYGGLMPKTFFLCPLTIKQRQDYAKCGMQIRIAIPIMLFIIFNALLVIFDDLPLFMLFVKLIIVTSGSISLNIYCQPVYSNPTSGQKVFPLMKGNYNNWNMTNQIFHIITLFILCTIEYDEKLWEIVLIAILIIMSVCICIHMVKVFYPQVINQAAYYENTQRK